jgi:hypothetical protein
MPEDDFMICWAMLNAVNCFDSKFKLPLIYYMFIIYGSRMSSIITDDESSNFRIRD